MICPQCYNYLTWFCDSTCEDVYGCDCSYGLIGQYVCETDDCSITIIQITIDCEGCVYGK